MQKGGGGGPVGIPTSNSIILISDWHTCIWYLYVGLQIRITFRLIVLPWHPFTWTHASVIEKTAIYLVNQNFPHALHMRYDLRKMSYDAVQYIVLTYHIFDIECTLKHCCNTFIKTYMHNKKLGTLIHSPPPPSISRILYTMEGQESGKDMIDGQ